MMCKLSITGDTAEVEPGLQLLREEPVFSQSTAEQQILVCKSETPGFSLTVLGGKTELTYHEKTDFFRAISFYVSHAKEAGYAGRKRHLYR